MVRRTTTKSKATRHLKMLLREGSLDLVEACLWVAAEEYPAVDVSREAARLRVIAGEAASRAAPHRNPFARHDAVRGLLFDELGFRGNLEHYHDPRNSYLNEVLNRRLGIPLSLSIVFLECARAAGFAARGVGLPGHFVVRLEFEGRTLYVDPFHGGRVITADDCRKLVARTTGRPGLFRRHHLDGVDERAMLGRMLLNLKHVYVQAGDYDRALVAVERLLLLRPDDTTELRDRGFIKAHLGRAGGAIADLEGYLEAVPGAPDASSVRGRLAWLQRKLSELN